MELGYKHTFTGYVRGIVEKQYPTKDKSGTWSKYFVCIEGENFNVEKFQLTKKAIDDGSIQQNLDKLQGKLVSIEFTIQTNNGYTTHYYRGSSLPLLVDANDKKTAA